MVGSSSARSYQLPTCATHRRHHRHSRLETLGNQGFEKVHGPGWHDCNEKEGSLQHTHMPTTDQCQAHQLCKDGHLPVLGCPLVASERIGPHYHGGVARRWQAPAVLALTWLSGSAPNANRETPLIENLDRRTKTNSQDNRHYCRW